MSYPELTPKRFLELKKNNPDFGEITAPILEREYKKDQKIDLAKKILSDEYEIISEFTGWPDQVFKYEIATENGNVRMQTQKFKNGYVICLVKKEIRDKPLDDSKIKENHLNEETKEELHNIAQNIWAAANILNHNNNLIDKPLYEALYNHFEYLRKLVREE